MIRHRVGCRTLATIVAAVMALGGAFVPRTSPAQAPRAMRAAEVIILKAARLLDGNGGAAVSPAMVRVEGEKIVAVGARLEVPAGARIIDLGSATLTPGWIDLHTHLTTRGDEIGRAHV